jgi:hypothetical protein
VIARYEADGNHPIDVAAEVSSSDHLISGGGNITTLNAEYQPGWVSAMFLCIIRCPFPMDQISMAQVSMDQIPAVDPLYEAR